jgi:hypothetical protein
MNGLQFLIDLLMDARDVIDTLLLIRHEVVDDAPLSKLAENARLRPRGAEHLGRNIAIQTHSANGLANVSGTEFTDGLDQVHSAC